MASNRQMNERGNLSPGARLLLLIAAIPGIALLVYQAFSLYVDGASADSDAFSLVYGIASVYLLFVVASGKAPFRAVKNYPDDR